MTKNSVLIVIKLIMCFMKIHLSLIYSVESILILVNAHISGNAECSLSFVRKHNFYNNAIPCHYIDFPSVYHSYWENGRA